MSAAGILCGRPWLLEPQALKSLIQQDSPVRPAQRRQQTQLAIVQGVAIVQVQGILLRDKRDPFAFMFGGSTYSEVQNALRLANGRADVESVLLDISSPGGEVNGAAETAHVVAELAKVKPVVAFGSGHMTSAAYWIASAASRVVCSPTCMVGSVGTAMEHVDQSRFDAAIGVKYTDIVSGKYKRMGSSHRPLDKESLDYLQSQVTDLNNVFLAAVRRNRRLNFEETEKIKEAQIHVGKAARAAGLVDAISFYDETLEALR